MQPGSKFSVRTLEDAFFFLKNAGVLAVNAEHKLHDFSKSQMNCQKLGEKKKIIRVLMESPHAPVTSVV